MNHVPVLLKESLEYLKASKGGKFIDGTFGNGGHARKILEANIQNQVLGIDLDQSSLDNFTKSFTQRNLIQRCKLVRGNYKDIKKVAEENNFLPVSGILLDLGFSSPQMDNPARGFSFQTDGPLDMRYDINQELTAEKIINSYSPKDLEKVFTDFGEEKFSRRIAALIAEQRKKAKINSTVVLLELIKTALPKPVAYRAGDSARRVFQALRIEVNQELENLKAFLPDALNVLGSGGRLVIISFHSLEDRIVKEFFVKEEASCVCPKDFPTCICEKKSSIKILTRKPIIASEEELAINSRAKPAKLRVAEKL